MRTLPVNMQSILRRWLDLIVLAHNDTQAFIAIELKKVGIVLTSAQTGSLVTRVELACEWADDKVKKHLQDLKSPSFAILQPFLRRQLWSSDAMQSFRLPTANFASLQEYFDEPADSAVVLQSSEFNDAMARWHSHELPIEHAADYVAFWRAMYTRKCFPLVSRAAVRALTVGYANIIAERTFSTMRNLEVNNRLSAKRTYLRNYLMLTCNRTSLYAMLASRAHQLARVKDILRPVLLPTKSPRVRSAVTSEVASSDTLNAGEDVGSETNADVAVGIDSDDDCDDLLSDGSDESDLGYSDEEDSDQ